MATDGSRNAQDLPRDNMVRLAIFDAIWDGNSETDASSMSGDELFVRVIGRLRVLVPRELHLVGERTYFDEKLQVCLDAGIVAEIFESERKLVTLTGRSPQVRYPDGEVRVYPPGLELARERLDQDNIRLRTVGFDVRKFIPSIADDLNGEQFKALLASMRELGFMKQFPVVKYEDGVVVDGLARVKAAETLDVGVEYVKYERMAPGLPIRQRDTPLNRVLFALHSNAGRLRHDEINAVYQQVATVTQRGWKATAADLELTLEWRKAVPSEYSAVFEVNRLPYRDGGEAKIQVTPDNKVMLRSLIEAGGLSNYKIKDLRDYVPLERARTLYSPGPKAVFARAEDLIAGIAAMQQERRATKRKVDHEWEQIRDWLISTFVSEGSRRDRLGQEMSG
jgi:hypothetical protein